MNKKQQMDEVVGEEAQPISDEEKILLESPDWWDRVDLELDKKIVHEKSPRKTIFFVMNLRNVENLSKGTDNLMVNDSSGVGKDWVCSAVFGLLPKGEAVKKVRISAKALGYLNDIRQSENGWKKSTLYLEDLPNTVLNDDCFKVMSSADPNGVNRTSIVVNNRIRNFDIYGKPSIIITIASSNPKPELLRRYPILNLDDSVQQTKEIMKRQSEYAMSGQSPEYDPLILGAISKLKRIKVRIPFAPEISEHFPKGNTIIRTHYPRFLDYIKSSCAFFQYQREQDEEGAYLASGQDYEFARQMIASTTSNELCIPLTKNQKKILEGMKQLGEGWLSFKEIFEAMPEIPLKERRMRQVLDDLVHLRFLDRGERAPDMGTKPLVTYKLLPMSVLSLPDFFSVKNGANSTHGANSTNTSNSANRDEIPLSEEILIR